MTLSGTQCQEPAFKSLGQPYVFVPSPVMMVRQLLVTPYGFVGCCQINSFAGQHLSGFLLECQMRIVMPRRHAQRQRHTHLTSLSNTAFVSMQLLGISIVILVQCLIIKLAMQRESQQYMIIVDYFKRLILRTIM
jgi:hypothetical protein